VSQQAVVIGWPVEHSKSPPMITAALRAMGIDGFMSAMAVPPEGLADAIAVFRDVVPLGASVTVPHKEAVLALVDDASIEVRAIGAANCLQFADGKIIAHNTDAGGFADSLGFTPHRAVILGAGGAARAVAYGLRKAHVAVIARRPATWTTSHAWSELPALLADADLVVDCTSAGLDPRTDEELADSVPLGTLPRTATVATLIYHRPTKLLERASALGYSTVDGRGMLVHQGARALTIWTGLPAPIEVMSRALDESLVRNG
jgi:shikimate dehydrogenase